MGLMLVLGVSEIFCAFAYYSVYSWRVVWIIFVVIPASISFLLSLEIKETPKFY